MKPDQVMSQATFQGKALATVAAEDRHLWAVEDPRVLILRKFKGSYR